MFSTEYDARQIRENKAKAKATRNACIDCAATFALGSMADCAPRINNRTKLVEFLAWNFDLLGYKATTKEDWIKECMSSFNLSFKTGVL